jgi:hypothetical protein
MKTLLVWLLVATSVLLADPVVVLLDDDEPGSWLVTVDGAGKTTAIRTKVVHVSGDAPDPDPDPDPALTPRATAIRDAALKATDDKNRERTASELAVLYREVARRVEVGELKGQATIAFITGQAADVVIAKGGTPAAWKPMRDVLNSQWTKLVQEGGKDADYAKLLRECGDGLFATTSKNARLDLRQILEAIRVILDLLMKLFPEGAK